MRTVQNLQFATLSSKPKWLKPSVKRGTKAQGIGYERKLANALQGSVHGQWFVFVDGEGSGYCQTDVLIIERERVIVLEAKLSDARKARESLKHLYLPVVEKALGLPARGVVVLRSLEREPETHRVVGSWGEMLERIEDMPTLHWLGRGVLTQRGSK